MFTLGSSAEQDSAIAYLKLQGDLFIFLRENIFNRSSRPIINSIGYAIQPKNCEDNNVPSIYFFESDELRPRKGKITENLVTPSIRFPFLRSPEGLIEVVRPQKPQIGFRQIIVIPKLEECENEHVDMQESGFRGAAILGLGMAYLQIYSKKNISINEGNSIRRLCENTLPEYSKDYDAFLENHSIQL